MRRNNDIIDTWAKALSRPGFKALSLLTAVSLGVVLWLYSDYIAFNETRTGFAFTDPYLAWFEPRDVTWLTFGVLYATLLSAIAVLIHYPGHGPVTCCWPFRPTPC